MVAGLTAFGAFDRPAAHAILARQSTVYGRARRAAHNAESFWRTRDRISFDDRRKHHRRLVCVLAGHKPDLWPFVMPRLVRAVPQMSDVCIVTPGIRDCAASRALCRQQGWSYLGTATNDVSLAQNVCFRLHPVSEMIVKVDEDMFLLPDTISTLLDEYEAVSREGVLDPGFVAPMIPLNGFCYGHLLKMLDLTDEFEQRFGRVRLACSGIPLQQDAEVAAWIWQRTAPLAALAERLSGQAGERLLCPIRFSIGAIAFEKSFWNEIRGFPVLRRKTMFGVSTLGGDEAHLCMKAVELSRPMIVTTRAVAGHFSFGPQYQGMAELLRTQPGLFSE